MSSSHPTRQKVAEIEYVTISRLDDFAALSAQWDPLVHAMGRPSPFMLHAWLTEWWRHHGPYRQMLVEAAFAGDALVGAIPIEVEHRRLGTRVAHFMGRHHAALADVLVGAAFEESLPSALLERIRQRVDYVDLFGLPATSVLLGHTDTRRASVIERIAAPTLDLSEGWEVVYRKKTSSKRRNLHSRRRRQLAELGELEIEVASRPPELGAALEHAFRLHDLRWQGKPDGSEFTTPVGKEFNRAAIKAVAPQGIPHILTLSVAGRPIAFHYYLLMAETMYVHRLAFDPALSRHSPGLLATLYAIEHAAENGATRVEFLGGDERYKMELADTTAPLLECIGFPSTPRGILGVALTRSVISTRLRLKRSPRVRSLYFRLAGKRGDHDAD
ncbi:MAG TPA: GNAT family N-acetyltransferase [Gaiellaceae bacterium]|nr:GNAT family N-acetyltransferase [Gaiellaceae bacterium]